MESQQASIDAFVSFIKNLNLHIEYVLYPNHPSFKKFKQTSIKIVSDLDKFVGEYNKKVIEQINSSKLHVPAIFYRSIKQKIEDEKFMRYQYKTYGLKYIFSYINMECHVHVELYKITGGVRTTSLAFEKLESCFLHHLSNTINETNVSVQYFSEQAEMFLQEVYKLMNGQIMCFKCHRFMLYHPDIKTILPPTLRCENFSQGRYSHQICM